MCSNIRCEEKLFLHFHGAVRKSYPYILGVFAPTMTFNAFAGTHTTSGGDERFFSKGVSLGAIAVAKDDFLSWNDRGVGGVYTGSRTLGFDYKLGVKIFLRQPA